MLVSSLTVAQPSVGFRAGANWSRLLSYDEGTGASWHSGYSFGVVASWTTKSRMLLQAEVLYTEVGEDVMSLEDDGFQVFEVKYVTSLKYVQIPLLVGCTFGEGKFKVITQSGLYLGLALGGETVGTAQIPYDPQSFTIDHQVGANGPSTVDVGFVINPGVRYALSGKSELGLDLRYTQGFTEVWDPKRTFDQRNKVFGVSLLYLYKF